MRRRFAYEGQVWDRIAQVIKVEEPVSFDALRRFFPDVRPWILDSILWEMVKCGYLQCEWEWDGVRLISLMYTIGSRKRG